MRKQFLSGVIAISTLAIASLIQTTPAKAITLGTNSVTDITVSDVGSRFGVEFNGQRRNGNPLNGLSSRAVFTLKSFVDSTAIFNVALQNTSNRGRISRLAFNTDPNPTMSVVTGGVFNNATGGFFNNPLGNVDVCLRSGTQNCTGGRGGLRAGRQTSFDLALSLPDPTATLLSLDNIGVRYQGSRGLGNAVGVGEITAVPTPAAILPGLVGMGMAAVRKKKQQTDSETDVV